MQYRPVDREPAPPAYRTTLQVVIADDAITFGIRAFDPSPMDIRAPLTRRDQVRRDQDFVSVILDPVGTRRSAQFVRINAAGVLADGVFIADTDNEDFSPDFKVEAAVQRLPDGYSVELRLPLVALRYPFEGGLPWRLMVARGIPRESSMLLLSAPLTKDALNFIAELQQVDGLDDVTARVRDRSFLSVRPNLPRVPPGTSTRPARSVEASCRWVPRSNGGRAPTGSSTPR